MMAATVKKVKEEVSSEIEESCNTICHPDRDARIAELTYYKAESRGFEPGRELEDWFETEREFIL